MKRLAWILVVVAITPIRQVNAQTRPDFSGTWNAPGSSLRIRQDEKTLTVTAGTEIRIYNLDGSDSRFERRTDRGSSQLTAQVRWVGSALLITTTTRGSIGTWQDLEVYSLDYGPRLTVVQVGAQTTQPMMHTTTTTYTRPASASSNGPARLRADDALAR
jgi:hypothetical protein